VETTAAAGDQMYVTYSNPLSRKLDQFYWNHTCI